MRILYGAVAEGLGHATRSRVAAERPLRLRARREDGRVKSRAPLLPVRASDPAPQEAASLRPAGTGRRALGRARRSQGCLRQPSGARAACRGPRRREAASARRRHRRRRGRRPSRTSSGPQTASTGTTVRRLPARRREDGRVERRREPTPSRPDAGGARSPSAHPARASARSGYGLAAPVTRWLFEALAARELRRVEKVMESRRPPSASAPRG
jgi:hypothetical protein